MKWILIIVFFVLQLTVIAQKPKTANDYFTQAMGLAAQNKFDSALLFFNKAIKLNPRHVDAYTQAGLVYVKLNNKDDAAICLKTAIKLKKDNTIAYNGLGILYKNVIGKPDSALYYFKKLITYNADTSAEANYNLAWCYNALQKEDTAITYLVKALAINNNYKPAYRELAYSYHKTKRYAEGIEQFKKNVAVSKVDLPIYYLGLMYLETNEKAKALEMLAELKPLNEKMASTLQKKIDAKVQ